MHSPFKIIILFNLTLIIKITQELKFKKFHNLKAYWAIEKILVLLKLGFLQICLFVCYFSFWLSLI